MRLLILKIIIITIILYLNTPYKMWIYKWQLKKLTMQWPLIQTDSSQKNNGCSLIIMPQRDQMRLTTQDFEKKLIKIKFWVKNNASSLNFFLSLSVHLFGFCTNYLYLYMCNFAPSLKWEWTNKMWKWSIWSELMKIIACHSWTVNKNQRDNGVTHVSKTNYITAIYLTFTWYARCWAPKSSLLIIED